jgi:Putative beta-barrel porin-2, OmpL-like. bbp2
MASSSIFESIGGLRVAPIELLAALSLATFAASAQDASEQPVDIASLDASGAQAAEGQLQIHGFAVTTNESNLSSGENTFDASALAVSLFQTTQASRLSFFGQLTLHRTEEEPFAPDVPAADGEEAGATETEIDNLFTNWVVSARRGVDLTLGKFDSPLGLERDDAPLNFQATNSFAFDFGRPVKFTGLMLHEAVSPHFDGFAILGNGWDEDTDSNHSKTGAVYGVWSPSLASHFGLGAIAGNEGAASLARRALVGTVLLQPSASWVVGAEMVAGRQHRPDGASGSDKWSGGSVFMHHRFAVATRGEGTWALTVRGATFDDADGVRTDYSQKVTSLTVSPQYLLGGTFFGPFHYLDRTTLPLPQLAVRLDLRWDRSDVAVFDHGSETLGKNRSTATLQVVYVF